MAAEIHAPIYGFDHTFMLQHLLNEKTGRKFRIESFVDSKTLFNFGVRNASTLEKRLQIDVYSIRESLDNKELESLSWIPESDNPADSLTKFKLSTESILWKIMKDNKIDISPTGWVKFKTEK